MAKRKQTDGQPAKMGRPRKEFDQQLFEDLCHIQCTLEEISNVMRLSEDTIERRCKSEYGGTFAEVWKQKSASGRISIRRAQMRVALGGSVPMLIWMGKQHLGQSEKQDLNANVSGEGAILVIPDNERSATQPEENDD